MISTIAFAAAVVLVLCVHNVAAWPHAHGLALVDPHLLHAAMPSRTLGWHSVAVAVAGMGAPVSWPTELVTECQCLEQWHDD